MERKCRINISAPNLVNICVDRHVDGEISGRFYHCYSEEPGYFPNVVRLLTQLEEFFDAIRFPQASTETRYLVAPKKHPAPVGEKLVDQRELIRHTGELGTFVTYVKFRQNSSWQGEVSCMELDETHHFGSDLEFIKLLNNALAALRDQKS